MSEHRNDLVAAVRSALGKVIDPELRRPITELGVVKNITIDPDHVVHVEIYLTIAACPKKTQIADQVTRAVADVPGTGTVKVSLDVMSDEQRTELRKMLRGDAREPVIPFAQPGSLTRVYTVASGKGGVGKSSVTVNLAAALAARGLSVGVLDADIYGHSIPRMMGTTHRPTQVESMILPPIAHDVKVISIAQFTQGNTPVVWRGPMLHRALQQFLADVYCGDLDVLLLDLPPGTGDMASSSCSAGVLLGELIVVGTVATYKGYRYPIEVIGPAVWLYHRFALSLRDVEELDACPRRGDDLRDDPGLVCEVRAGLREEATSASSPSRR